MARKAEGMPSMTAHDAVLAVAIHRFTERRSQYGERMTLQAAERILNLAGRLNIHTSLAVPGLGLQADFTLCIDELYPRFAQLLGAGCRGDLRKLEHALSDVTVAQLDRSAEVAGGRSEEARNGSEH